MRRLNRLQVPNLGFSSHRPDSPSLLGRLAESVTYSSTRIPLGLAESPFGLAESTPKLRVFFPFLVFKTLGLTLRESNFFMDSGESSHITFNQGTMCALTLCSSKFIMVGNGVVLHVNSIGECFFPLTICFKQNVPISEKWLIILFSFFILRLKILFQMILILLVLL